jgi:hypothetical protein
MEEASTTDYTSYYIKIPRARNVNIEVQTLKIQTYFIHLHNHLESPTRVDSQ